MRSAEGEALPGLLSLILSYFNFFLLLKLNQCNQLLITLISFTISSLLLNS